ncbi:uncharacterized protein [Aristolochia californica]|uniref:uncharacterized protein n=1 Tax=Aristolochia californica TaxID=171875 RepID=UPI0035D94287
MDQRLLSLLLSYITEEAMAEAVGLSTTCEVWLALENAFSHWSKAREIRLKDDLQQLKCGNQSFVAYYHIFKGLYDQLHAIGRPADNTDKLHWFLLRLGTEFSTFSITQMALMPLPHFCDLVSQEESFELFQKSLESSVSPATAFTTAPQGSDRSIRCGSGRTYG